MPGAVPGSIDLNDIRLLIQVIEHGSYTAAARASGVPKSTISQRITALERTIGTGLIRRTSRSFSLTETGQQLLPQARAVESLARQMERALLDRGQTLQGTLRVSCSNALAQFALAGLVPRFLAQHAQAAVRVEASNRLIDLVAEGYDLTVRGHVGPRRDSTLRQRVIGRARWAILATPSWVKAWEAAHGPIECPEALTRAEALHFGVSLVPPAWSLSREGRAVEVRLAPRLTSDDMATLLAAAAAGAGVTCLPGYVAEDAVASGQLVRLLPDWEPPTSEIIVMTPPRPQSSRLAVAFSDFLAREMPRIVGG